MNPVLHPFARPAASIEGAAPSAHAVKTYEQIVKRCVMDSSDDMHVTCAATSFAFMQNTRTDCRCAPTCRRNATAAAPPPHRAPPVLLLQGTALSTWVEDVGAKPGDYVQFCRTAAGTVQVCLIKQSDHTSVGQKRLRDTQP